MQILRRVGVQVRLVGRDVLLQSIRMEDKYLLYQESLRRIQGYALSVGDVNLHICSP